MDLVTIPGQMLKTDLHDALQRLPAAENGRSNEFSDHIGAITGQDHHSEWSNPDSRTWGASNVKELTFVLETQNADRVKGKSDGISRQSAAFGFFLTLKS